MLHLQLYSDQTILEYHQKTSIERVRGLHQIWNQIDDIIIIIWSPLCKSGREWEHSISPKSPTPHNQPMEKKKIKEKEKMFIQIKGIWYYNVYIHKSKLSINYSD